MASGGFKRGLVAVVVGGYLFAAYCCRGLERHAEIDRLAVGYAALDAAAPVGYRAEAARLLHEHVVVVRPAHRRAREAGADLEAAARGDRHHRLREHGVEFLEDRLAPARRDAAAHARDDAAYRVAAGFYVHD